MCRKYFATLSEQESKDHPIVMRVSAQPKYKGENVPSAQKKMSTLLLKASRSTLTFGISNLNNISIYISLNTFEEHTFA